MDRPFSARVLVIIALAVFGGPVQFSVAAEPSGLHLLQSAIALGAAPDGSPIEVKTFYKSENIQFYTKVTFDPARESGRNHRLVYKWYTGDVVSLTFEGQKRFDVSPAYWWAFVHVSHLTPGHHRAELYIDDQLFASGEFDIKSRDRPNEPAEETAIKDSAVALLLAGDTQHFDELASRYRASQERTASGTWKLSMLYNAIDAESFAQRDPHWKDLEDLADAWLTREANSPTAVVLNARILYQHAWSWRGSGYSGSVPAQNRQLYEQLIERARGVLDERPNVAQQDPEWDTLRIAIAREQGADSNEILAMAERALTRWPCFYAIHNSAVRALLPRWGGSRQDIQAYVRLAVEHSRAREGTQAYARIYYYVARTATGDVLDELNHLGAKWPPLQQSLTEILQKYPSSFNRDIARYMASFAGDAVAYRAYGRAATSGFTPIAWWDTLEWRQQEDAWAFEGKLARGSLSSRVHAYLSFLGGEGPEFWEPLRWVVFVVVLIFEGGFQLFDWFARRSTSQWTLSQDAARTFNPFDYPRMYFLMPVLGRFSMRLGVWMLMLGAASAYLLTTVPWPDPQETRMVIVGLIVIAATGAAIAVNVVASRVILRADDLELRRLLSRKVIRRNDILGIRRPALKAGLRMFEVVPRMAGFTPLVIPPVLRADDAFRLWFESLPALAQRDRESQ